MNCPECDVKVDEMPTRSFEWGNTVGTFPMVTMDGTDTADVGSTLTASYPEPKKTYKCSNPKCWVTKITESWE